MLLKNISVKLSVILVLISLLPVTAQESRGILIEVKKEKDTDAQLIRVEVCNENIFRVTAAPGTSFADRASLMISKTVYPEVEYNVNDYPNEIEITTSKASFRINKNSGRITFYDSEGNILLAEKENGRLITPAVVLGESTYNIQQLFESPDDEAFFGLGAHQNNIWNYKGHDVDLWQYNIVDIIPMLVSSKNYGILWDNNSRTKFGDIREYQSISSLKLFDKDGKIGGLTAEYFKDPDFTSLYTSRSENRIEHEYLDVNDSYPDGFTENVAAVRWSGEIESDKSGTHKLKLYSSSYAKVWIDDSLVLDSWRQNWLPWNNHFNINLVPGKRCKIKIEWIHNNGYIGLRYLDPQDEIYNKNISLYSEVGDQIDYYFIAGKNTDEVIAGYRELTGTVPMMPKWAFGLWQSRERYRTQDEILSVVKEFRERKIPFDNIVLDWHYWPENKWGDHDFDEERFPDPGGMIKELHEELNSRIMISVWPKFYVGTNNYEEFRKNGWLYMRNVEKEQKDWVGSGYVSTFYDPYSTGARKLFWEKMERKLFSLGIDAWWLDSTEPDIQSNLSPDEWMLRIQPTALGSASRYRNTFSLMNSKAVFEGQKKSDPEKRVFILTRSAFAGQQRYAAATWSGDIASRWYDLKAQIPAGLNFSISGIPYWTTDVGGFSVEPRYENPSNEDTEEWRELNVRWFQFATFCPLLRVHGQFPYREMWNISPENHPAYKTMLKYNKLRYRLLPYIYSLSAMVTRSQYTVMRPLVMDFNNDWNAVNTGDQFMFGPSLLINPVTEYKARSRKLYLPAGSGWYDLMSGKYFQGGNDITADAPYGNIPVYVKEGSILPLGPVLQYSTEKNSEPIQLYVFTGKDASFTLYEDEGVNNNYEKGAFSTIELTYTENSESLNIGNRTGSFTGMPVNRKFEIVWIDPSTRSGLMTKPSEVIEYNGTSKTIKRQK